MITRFLTTEEIQDLYPKLFKKAFGYTDNLQAPTIVAIFEMADGTIPAFLSGYWLNKLVFYIQYCGVMPVFAKQNNGTPYLIEGMDFLRKEIGAMGFLTMTPNKNLMAMKVLLNCGFVIIGTRQDSNGQLYVEWSKEVRNG